VTRRDFIAHLLGLTTVLCLSDKDAMAATVPVDEALSPSSVLPSLRVFFSEKCLQYQGPPVGVFQELGVRVKYISDDLNRNGFKKHFTGIQPATMAQLERVHGRGYLKRLEKLAFLKQDEFAYIHHKKRTLPTLAGPYKTHLTPFEAGSLAAGGAIGAVEAVMEKKARYGLAIIRPPGHHARPNKNMGFCIFNNAAIAARHLQSVYGLKKIAIVDWDVHHGNGTQEIFYRDPSVLYISTHQKGLYPRKTGKPQEIGVGEAKGQTINIPLPKGSGDREAILVYNDVLAPMIREFKPDFILVSAGQDAHKDDFVSQLEWSEEGYATLTQLMINLAQELCQDRLAFLLEGGYNPRSAATSMLAIANTLAHGSSPYPLVLPTKAPTKLLQTVLDDVLLNQQPYWRCLKA
jgi:acetoin utilization deacetylase AcuC-like enzyme